MATNFPNAIDAFNNPTSANHLDDVLVLHSAQHSNINDAAEAIEAKLGIDMSSVENSLDYITNLLLLTQTQHESGKYREILYHPTKPILPEYIVWYVDNTKIIKLIQKQYVYGAPIAVLPSEIILTLFDGSSFNNTLRVIQDSIIYNKVFEVSRSRVVI